MIKALNIVFVVLGLLFIAKKTVYYLHMFQLNLYMGSRYFRWMKNNLLKVFIIPELVLLALFVLFNKNIKFNVFLLVIASLYYLILLKIFNTKKQKKPLVYTARVKRLLAVIILLLVLIIGCLKLSDLEIPYGIIILLLSNVMFFIIYISNLLVSPLELAIKKSYLNDAINKIRNMHNLTIIGITGSYGKTTTKNILNSIQ